MSARRATNRPGYTASVIQRLARTNKIAVVASANDVLAHHVTRLSGDDIDFDPVENTIVALQRAGILDRVQAVRLQARYLREAVRDI
ncbi:conserved protein of unknown function [Bradyrhizobium sp. ORS 285]|uniref:hypothetical protein n=1 Tax=Bradyrhizobium sp. ORS 285 TaxID=115808 RepID=UPI000240A06C|nr:hypothetical protein [Bradyrhizobium sp. ORS 285]CCD88185.1 conserved hypothetical protein [Bradyrhizobium sp. ORS 285]SMX60799.1 conserved protein of unknown function [Bradyrhizobium sp. ORS 285]